MKQLEWNKQDELQYEEFLNKVSVSLRKSYPDTICPELIKVQKNNAVSLSGIRIVEQGRTIAPGFYLQNQFKEYQRGEVAMDEIANQLIQCYEKEKRESYSIIEGFHFDWEEMKHQITFRLVNKEKNTEMLKEVPYEDFLDLALVYQYSIQVSGSIQGTILIRNEHLTSLNITEDELKEAAKNNKNELYKPVIYEMKLLLKQLCGASQEEIEDIESPKTEEERLFGDPHERTQQSAEKDQLYVFTNQSGMYGAAALANQEQLELFSKKIEGNYYILPSSVHEVIFVPDNKTMSIQSLSDMVKEVNTTQVAETEFLSNSVYYYDMSLKKVRRLT